MTQDEERFRNEIFVEKVYGEPTSGVVVNIGAHVGLLEEYMHDTATMMYAIEPSIDNYNALVERTKNWSNVKCFNLAIGKDNTIRKLYKGTSDGAWSFGSNWNGEFQEIQTMTLESFMKQEGIEHIDLLKIDCEGSESEIIFTAEFGNIAPKIDRIVGELHGGVNKNQLKDYGYELEEVATPQMLRARRIK
jgi:FkbM family methyltransferase